MENNYFEILSKINVNDKVKKKNGLNYLSWSYAWGEIKKVCPNAQYKVYESPQTGLNYFHDGHTAYVKVSITLDNLEHVEYLPVMDLKNCSMKLENITSFNVNKSIQRALTKAIARHGLGLYIYMGEDLPDDDEEEESAANDKENSLKDILEKYEKEINDLKININKLAPYLKKSSVEDLTEEDIILAIRQKKEILAKKGEIKND